MSEMTSAMTSAMPSAMISGSESESAQALGHLQDAHAALVRTVDGVDGSMNNLLAQYQGVDGNEYNRLLRDWITYAMSIAGDLTSIIDRFEENTSQMRIQSVEAESAIASAANSAAAIMNGR
ncbi:hypothetical protein [Streptomyces sp. NPDC050263]|uniref:hypothetical protein n=1 Tax=Streptomyces sp. NPDC050263 TaxID=3155037 RepID=UPI0034236096